MERLVPLLVVFAFVATLAAGSAFFLRWIRKSQRRRVLAAWGIHLIGAGMNQQPATQERIEEVARQTRIKKTAESGDPEY